MSLIQFLNHLRNQVAGLFTAAGFDPKYERSRFRLLNLENCYQAEKHVARRIFLKKF